MAFFARILLRLLYGFRSYGTEHLSTRGPVLLIPNHVSWIDFILVGACLDSDWRFVTSSTTAEISWLHRRIMRSRRAFPVDTTSPYAVKHIAEYLRQGGRLVLFAEGRISTTGTLMKLFEGTGFLLLKTHAKVITCYLRGAQRLPCVKHPGWTRWTPRISVHFSAAQEPPNREFSSTVEGRRRLTAWLRHRMVEHQFDTERTFGPQSVLAAIEANRYQRPGWVVLEDSTQTQLSYRKVLVGIEVLARRWRYHFPLHGQRIGVLLPNVNATPIVINSLWAAGQVPALLNFSTGIPTMIACCELASIRVVITSRTFLEKAKLDLSELETAGIQLRFLEDIRTEISGAQRLTTLLKQMFFRPYSTNTVQPDETAVVLFTSGSEGVPKGVELTQANLLANINQMLSVIDITDADRAFNALPLFHSFGLTIGTLLPLVRGLYVFLYPSPLHYRMVPAVIYDRNCTIMLGTNTFLNGYARKAHRYDFHTIRYLFAGAEKTQAATFETWANKYGLRILEGYGATECSPCISVNTRIEGQVGTAGRLLPRIDTRIIPVPGVTEGGRLHVRGPNIMKGYLNPEANATFQAQDGWYDTGDIAEIDDNGFVHILGRLKRFAKVSGEMVSLTAVEECLAGKFKHLGLRTEVAIIAEPDAQRGEVLIAVANHPDVTLDAIRALIRDQGHSNLCVPRQLVHVRDIPKLGTGKLDHRSLVAQISGNA